MKKKLDSIFRWNKAFQIFISTLYLL